MSPLLQKIIVQLSNETDEQVLLEVLDFYEYLRNKRCREANSLWSKIAEDEPTDEEKMILDSYVNATDDLSDFTVT